MEETITQAKAEFLRAKEQLLSSLATTPDDKLNWSPATTARTPLQLAAHAASAVSGIVRMLNGEPLPYPDTGKFDASMRLAEQEYTTREQVLSLMEQNSAQYLTWIDALSPEQVSSTITIPFGSMPMAVAVTLPADHINYHVAQLNYLQTICGDREWHMGS